MHDQEKIVRSKVQSFIIDNGEFPSNVLLRRKGNYNLHHLISKNGGYNYYRKVFGYPVKRVRTEEEIINKLREIVEKLDYFPTIEKLRQVDSSLKAAVMRHGGINYYRKILGFPEVRKCWSIEKIKEKLSPLVVNNKMPTSEMLISSGNTLLLSNISKFGGLRKIAKKLGYESHSGYVTSDGHYVSSAKEFLLDEYFYKKSIKHEVNGIIVPGRKFRYDFKISDTYVELWGYRRNEKSDLAKSYHKARAKKEELYIGKKLVSIEAEIFSKPYQEIVDYFDLMFKDFPQSSDVFIVNDIKHPYFWTHEKTLKEAKDIIIDKGYLPSKFSNTLRDAMKKNGGVNYFRKLLGQKIYKKSKWTEADLIEELKCISDNLGGFPTAKQLLVMKKSSVIAEIKRFGGFNKFQNLLGYKPKRCRRHK